MRSLVAPVGPVLTFGEFSPCTDCPASDTCCLRSRTWKMNSNVLDAVVAMQYSAMQHGHSAPIAATVEHEHCRFTLCGSASLSARPLVTTARSRQVTGEWVTLLRSSGIPAGQFTREHTAVIRVIRPTCRYCSISVYRCTHACIACRDKYASL
jgi:hypothetical protein